MPAALPQGSAAAGAASLLTRLPHPAPPLQAHNIEPPSNTVVTNKAELLSFFHQMYRMRRMEISADMLYKVSLRGRSCRPAAPRMWGAMQGGVRAPNRVCRADHDPAAPLLPPLPSPQAKQIRGFCHL